METREDVPYLYIGLFVVGGLCVATGIIHLYYSFGFSDGPLNQHIDKVGFTGLDNLALQPSGDFAIPFVLVGLCCLVIANATAWKETDGY